MLTRLGIAFFLALSWPAFAVPECDVRRTQEMLAQQGYDPGPLDGMWGPGTREAVKAFQEQSGLSQTAELDAETCNALFTSSQIVANPETSPVAPKPPALEAVQEIKEVQELLVRFGTLLHAPDGLPGKQTDNALDAFQRITGHTDVTESEELLALLSAEINAREERLDNWLAQRADIIRGGEDAEITLEKRENPTRLKFRYAFIPTDLPSHIGFRDENGLFRTLFAPSHPSLMKIEEPSVFEGTGPFEFIGYFVNLSEEGSECVSDYGGKLQSAIFIYLKNLENAGSPVRSASGFLGFDSSADIKEDRELWCFDQVRWGQGLAETRVGLPERVVTRLAAMDSRLAKVAAQEAAAEEAAQRLEKAQAEMADITDVAELEVRLTAALVSEDDATSAAAIEAIESRLSTETLSDSECHIQFAGFAPYVPDPEDLDLDLPIFATLMDSEIGRLPVYGYKSEHSHDKLDWIKPVFMNGLMSAGLGSGVGGLPPPGITLRELLSGKQGETIVHSGAILDGAVIRIEGKLVLGFGDTPIVKFDGTGDK